MRTILLPSHFFSAMSYRDEKLLTVLVTVGEQGLSELNSPGPGHYRGSEELG